MLRAFNDPGEYEYDWGDTNATRAANNEPLVDPEKFGQSVVDSLLGGVGGATFVDENGVVQSAVMGIFNLQDAHLVVCFVMLIVNVVVFRVFIYRLVVWRANQKK